LISPPVEVVLAVLSIFIPLTIVALASKLRFDHFLIVLCLLSGILAYQVRCVPGKNNIARYAENGYQTVAGLIDGEPKQKGERLSFPLKTEKPAPGTVFVSLTAWPNELHYGERIEVRGVITNSQGYANPLLPEGKKVHFLNTYYYKKLPGGGGNPLKKLALWCSRRFNAVLLQIMPQKEASLLGSILLGSAVSPLDDGTKETYRQAGLIHLLVVSGTQVSILIGICLALTRVAGLPLWPAVTLTSFFNLLLVIMTGAGASILRAAIMGEIMLLGLLCERSKEVYTALALSALVLLVADPLTLFDLGFQLSFAATWALVYIAPVLKKKLPPLLAISLAPILATSPLIAFNMSQVTPGALLSNLLVLPWVETLVILGLAATLLGFICLPLAQLLGNTLWLALVLLDRIAAVVAALPGACFYIAAPSAPLVLGYYAGLVAVLACWRKEEKLSLNKKRLLFIAVVLVLVAVWHGAFLPAGLGGRELTVTFLDVGQGDCILVEGSDGKRMLIDGGGSERVEQSGDPIGEKVVVPFLRRKGINKLDLVVLTHPHADHVGGLNVVLDKIKVDRVLDSGQLYDSQAYRRFKELVRVNAIKYCVVRAGEVINFGQNIKGYIINPVQPLLGDTNSDSIVMRLVYGEISFLLTGDVESGGEEKIRQSSAVDLRSTVLKVGHHGSATSTSADLLRAVSPRYAVISVGRRNRYRHPARPTLARLLAAGITLFRTDEDGAVVVRTDGRRLLIDRQRPGRSPRTRQPSSGWTGPDRGPRTLRRG